MTTATSRPWLDYRAVWRWHFYAGLFSIPFILWLSITGSIYLFRPQVERILDRPYDHLAIGGSPATPAAETRAALAAVPGSVLDAYQLPAAPDSAAQILVDRGAQQFRVYVHPGTAAVLHVVEEDHRLMRVIFHLHGELLAGDRGSRVVELAASWAIILVLTGLYLWWPRQTERLAGVLYLRLRSGRRIFWRDVHAVTGVWVSGLALFLLFSGLPWSKGWGDYLKYARSLGSKTSISQDWTNGSSSEAAARIALTGKISGTPQKAETEHIESSISQDNMAGMDMGDMADMPGMSSTKPAPTGEHSMHGVTAHAASDPAPLDRLLPVVASLHLAAPVLITPPTAKTAAWTARSDAQNRTARATVTLDSETGAILTRQNFNQKPFVDRAVGFGVAAHEGQLFGWANQLLGLLTALGLITLSVSAVVLWWRRRSVGVLGAPVPVRSSQASVGLVVLVVALGVLLPEFGVSLAIVLVLEFVLLRRIPATQRWLGL